MAKTHSIKPQELPAAEGQKPKQPEFGYLPKESISDMINYLINQNPEIFKQYFTLVRAMDTKVTLSEPDPTDKLFEK